MAQDVELIEVRDFLATAPPFDQLPAQVLDGLPPKLTMQYFRRGTAIMAVGRDNTDLYVLRSGAVDVVNSSGRLVERGGAGTCFGSTTLVRGNPSRFDVTAIEDVLALVVPGDVFHALAGAHEPFARFFDSQRACRMSEAAATIQAAETGSSILKTRVRDLARPPTIVSVDTSIQETARRMTADRRSSALVMLGRVLAGIVTDRDLRAHVVAEAVAVTAPVHTVMTPNPVTADADAVVFEIVLDMVTRNIHHLPIVDGETPIGVVTTSDIVRAEQDNPVFLTREIAAKTDVAGIAAVARRLPRASRDPRPSGRDGRRHRPRRHRGRRCRGPATDPARRGRTGAAAGALLLGGDGFPRPAGAGPRRGPGQRAAARRRVRRGGARTLFRRPGRPRLRRARRLRLSPCPGKIMATNPNLRQPVRVWRHQFDEWLHRPVSEAILRASIFFDMRPVHGAVDLYAALTDHVAAAAPRSPLFLGHLTKAALTLEPPIGFFRGLVVAKAGEHRDTFDIKAGGVRAVVEIARVIALSRGIPAVNTRQRLQDAIDAVAIDRRRGDDLRDAFEFISYVRLRHQALQVRAGATPDNHVRPDALTEFDQRHLREAFAIVAKAQRTLSHLYSVSFMR